MPVWRCPHCGTPQAESSRCWVCHRSTTSCASCRHFRRGIASGLGLCGLDPRHVALRGSEMRACWAAPPPADDPQTGVSAPLKDREGDDPERRPPRTFVPIDEIVAAPDRAAVASAVTASPAPGAMTRGDAWSLWGDAEA